MRASRIRACFPASVHCLTNQNVQPSRSSRRVRAALGSLAAAGRRRLRGPCRAPARPSAFGGERARQGGPNLVIIRSARARACDRCCARRRSSPSARAGESPLAPRLGGVGLGRTGRAGGVGWGCGLAPSKLAPFQPAPPPSRSRRKGFSPHPLSHPRQQPPPIRLPVPRPPARVTRPGPAQSLRMMGGGGALPRPSRRRPGRDLPGGRGGVWAEG